MASKIYRSDYFKTILRNRYVVIIGDSNMKSFYKDVVNFLQTDELLSREDLSAKGEMTFRHDMLFDGGSFTGQTNGRDYREVRQYQDPHHLVRFYFVTKAYGSYIKEVLCSIVRDAQIPDYLVIGSCLWDITRYGPQSLEIYRRNVKALCENLKRVVNEVTRIIWTTSLPVSNSAVGDVFENTAYHFNELMPFDQVLANHTASAIAKNHGINVLDFYFIFKNKKEQLENDGLHWNPSSYRIMTKCFIDILLDINPTHRGFSDSKLSTF